MWHESFMIYLQTNVGLYRKDAFNSVSSDHWWQKTVLTKHITTDNSYFAFKSYADPLWLLTVHPDCGCSFRPLKDVSPALLSVWLLEPSVWRLSFPCHAQSFSVNPFIHLLVLPASRQLGWEHGTRPMQSCFRATRVLGWNPPQPSHYCLLLKREDRERWKMDMKQRQEGFMQEKRVEMKWLLTGVK